MNDRKAEPKVVREDDALRALNPHWRWNRALPAPGHTNVDFEVRVDFRRLHGYRLGRAKQALKASNLGALLLFDVNNIRYVTGTKIGEWERDKLCRFALLAGDKEPVLWDFGSAAVHHRLYCDWLPEQNFRAGMLGMRGTVPPVGRTDAAPRQGDRRTPEGGGRRRRAARRRSGRARHVASPSRRQA